MPSGSPIVIRNPNSGDGRRTERARAIARERGYEVLDSEGAAHTVELAAEAAERTATVLAWGGRHPERRRPWRLRRRPHERRRARRYPHGDGQ